MNLREWRKKSGLTQKEISKILNVSQNTYSQYETGKIEPDIKNIIKLANIFKIPTDLLLERKWETIIFETTENNLF